MINVKAFNLPGAPGTRPTPKDKPLHDPTEPVKFGVCGGANEPCCPNRNCDDTKLNCTGAAGSDVCTPMVCGMTNGTCCGLPNQCLSTTDQCIGTTCTPKPPACGDLVQAGGNAPSQRSINLVAIKGTSRLTINTFKVPDNLVVSYGNKELVNTGCVFTGMTIDGCADFAGLGNYTGCSLESTTLVNNCWCCKSGACYTDIPYSGDTSLMTVTVNPACGPGGGTTEWNYSLACPR
jgi:hypothetical protein